MKLTGMKIDKYTILQKSTKEKFKQFLMLQEKYWKIKVFTSAEESVKILKVSYFRDLDIESVMYSSYKIL